MKAALGQEGIVEGVDYRGVPVLAVIRAVPNSPWFLVAKMDAAEVYAPMRERLWLTVLFVGILLFGLGAAVGFLWRQQHAALYRQKYEGERKYRNLFESSRDALMIIEPPSWKFTVGNPAMLEMFRLKNAGELTALGPWDISPERQPDGRASGEKAREMIETAMREGSHFFEWTHKRIDGEEFPATVLLTRMEQAGKVVVQATVRDITEQKQAEEERKKLLVRRQGTNELQQSLLEPALLEEKLRKVTDGIVRLFDADFCRIWLIRPGDLCQGECIHAAAEDGPHVCRYRDRCLHLLASSGRYTHVDGQTHRRVPFGCYKIGRIASGEDHKFLTNDAPNDPRVHDHQWARELGLVSFAGYQIRVPGGDTLGVLALFAKHPIDESEDAMLDGLSSAVALVVEQATVQELLREEKDYTQNIIRSMADMLVVVAPDGTIATVNEATCQSLGYSEAELIGQPATLLFEEEEEEEEGGEEEDTTQLILSQHALPVNRTMLRRLVREGSVSNVEKSLRTKTGDRIPVLLSGAIMRDNKGGIRGIVCLALDITERKRAEAALLELKAAVEQSVDGIALTDLDGHIRFVNGAWAKMHGYSVDEVIGRHLGIFHTIEQLETEMHPYLKELLEAGSREGEVGHTRKDGTTFPTWMSCTVLTGADQKPFGLIGTALDITDRKRVEAELIRARTAAEAANRAKSEFLANMSHEIRTPMTAILGYADLILDENAGRTTREHVAVIKRNGEHLLQVIGDILDLSKIEAGKLQIEPTRCSPVQVVAEVASLMRTQAAAKQVKLKTELAQVLPETVLTDPLRLRQVLVNLVGNAIKFTDHGEIRLAVRLASDSGRVSLCFDVTDTGIGMNAEQVGKLFRPFSQVDSSSTRKFGGTGLGLCISKHLAEALGGGLEVRSEPGKGSTFSLTIDPGPLDGTHMIQNAQEALLDRPPPATTATPNKIVLHGRILLAEDGLDNRQLIVLLLKNAGAHVTAVENGQLAVEAALAAREAGEPFDVILVDMQMPVLDGYGATRQLREQGYTGPIVALTAHAMVEDCQKCLDAGCNDYLSKPFQHRTLLKMVARHITAEKEGQTSSAGLCPAFGSGRTRNDSADSLTTI